MARGLFDEQMLSSPIHRGLLLVCACVRDSVDTKIKHIYQHRDSNPYTAVAEVKIISTRPQHIPLSFELMKVNTK